MKKALAATALAAASLLTPGQAHATPAIHTVENWGQCIHYLVSIDVNPSELRPKVSGAGPGVIIYDKDGNEAVKLVGTQAQDFRLSCHYEEPEV